MNITKCEKLSTAIYQLQSLKNIIDRSLSTFEPKAGIVAQEKAKNLISQNIPLEMLLGSGNYFQLVREYGVEELKNRIIRIQPSALTSNEILEELHEQGDMIPNLHVRNMLKLALQNRNDRDCNDEKSYNLIRLKVSDFGFPKGARINALMSTAVVCGFGYVPADVAPLIALQSDQLPEGKSIVAMSPISESKCGFTITKEDAHTTIQLNYSFGEGEFNKIYIHPGNSEFIFKILDR
jgi:hypothetical protein